MNTENKQTGWDEATPEISGEVIPVDKPYIKLSISPSNGFIEITVKGELTESEITLVINTFDALLEKYGNRLRTIKKEK